MKQIWAPWRMEYIGKEKSGECIFCALPKANEDKKNFILHRGDTCFIIMNLYPYNAGHLMVSPNRHLSCITQMNEKENTELNHLTQKCVEILRTVKSPEG
ncbi:HIT family protein, partial [hydrothermal vent metagenome]